MLKVKEDRYNGLIIEPESIHASASIFKVALEQLLEEATFQKKFLLWIDL
ncbi:MAG: Unknown protein, partial [uncultured Sulfurovum sp.]